MRRVAIGWI